MLRLALPLTRRSASTARAASIVPTRFAYSPLSWSALKQPTAIRHLSSEWQQRPPSPRAQPVSSSSRADDQARLDRILRGNEWAHRSDADASAFGDKDSPLSSTHSSGSHGRGIGSPTAQPSSSSASGRSSQRKTVLTKILVVLACLAGANTFLSVSLSLAMVLAESASDVQLSVAPEKLREWQRKRAAVLELMLPRSDNGDRLTFVERMTADEHIRLMDIVLRSIDAHTRFEQSTIGWMAAAHRIVSLYGPTLLRLRGQQSEAEADAALHRAHWILCVEEAVWRIGAQREFRQVACAALALMIKELEKEATADSE